jgi:hypothetical protein
MKAPLLTLEVREALRAAAKPRPERQLGPVLIRCRTLQSKAV